jgi:hypothetical protein
MPIKFLKSLIFIFIFFVIFGHIFSAQNVFSSDAEFGETKACFENFIRCELTRTSAKNYFNGKVFTISMVNFFDIKKEGDIIVITGAVECWVIDKHKVLFVAVGVKEIFEKKKVSYLVIRNKDFSILGTELMNYPYKERCNWSQYWVDID